MIILSKRVLLYGQGTSKPEFCEDCVFSKQKQLSFSTTIHNTMGTLDYIHLDLWGPSHVSSKGNGFHYMLSFIYNVSRKVWVYFLKEKNKVLTIFK